MFEFVGAYLGTYVNKQTLIGLLNLSSGEQNKEEWFTVRILKDDGNNMYDVRVDVNKRMAMFYRDDFPTLLSILGFVEPETKEVAFCSSCGAEYDKAITRCLNCDSELVVKKVLANERDRHRII